MSEPNDHDDDPRDIAKYLIEAHGVEGAFREVMLGVERCHGNGDTYALSIWREVRNLIRTTEHKNELD